MNDVSRREFLRQSLAVAGGIALSGAANAAAPGASDYDIIICGATSAAITAAVQARRMGRSVAIVCPEKHLGGLTTSGLGWTDCKNGDAIGGLAREFYARVWQFYQNPAVWTRQTRESYLAQRIGAQPGPAIDERKRVMWTFEPHAAERVIETWLADEKVPVFRDEWLDRSKGVVKRDDCIMSIAMLSGRVFRGKMFIDASYEGDLVAAAGVRYRVGRDSRQEFDEPLNGVRFAIPGTDRYVSKDGNDYPGVDPYVVPGKPESGLLPGIESESKDPLALGVADAKRLQCFNYRLCLTRTPENQVPFAKPEGYDAREFELAFRILENGGTSGFTTQAMPNHKTDSNAQGRISGDFIGGSFSAAEGWTYGDASYAKRREVNAAHRRYQEGLLWTVQNHPRVPNAARRQIAGWGLAKDEFVDNGNWPYQLYVREARRMEGLAMVTQHHVLREPGYEIKDPIGLGSYSLDSHPVRRIVIDGKVRNEGNFYVYWDKPYSLPYGCIVPRRGDVRNLFAPAALSATHAAFGSIRMEPTYMVLGQSAATAAVLAIEQNVATQDVPYRDLAQRLQADRQILSHDTAPKIKRA